MVRLSHFPVLFGCIISSVVATFQKENVPATKTRPISESQPPRIRKRTNNSESLATLQQKVLESQLVNLTEETEVMKLKTVVFQKLDKFTEQVYRI